MLQSGLYERYVPEVEFDSINHIHCFRGVDHFLKRDVLLLIWEGRDEQLSITPPGKQEMTLQLLDIGKNEKENYLVYEYVPGLPLSQAVEEKKLNIREALGLLIQIVEMISAFRVEGKCKPLLLLENFWLTEKGEIKVLNYWDDCGVRGQEITVLYQLFHQMIFGKVTLQLPARQIIEEISLSYQGNPYVIRKTLKSYLHKEEKGEIQLTPEFLKQFHNDLVSLYHYIKNTENKSNNNPFDLEDIYAKKLEENKENQPKKGKMKIKPGRWIGFGLLVLVILLGGKFLFTKINEFLNKQPPTPFQIEVPNVKGLSLAEADQVLNEKGVHYQYYYEKSFISSLLHESGTVVKQKPSSGEYMYRSDLMELWIIE